MTVGEMTVGKMTVSKMTVGKMTVGKMTRSQTDETSRESIFGLTTSLSGRIPFKETFQRKKERKTFSPRFRRKEREPLGT